MSEAPVSLKPDPIELKRQLKRLWDIFFSDNSDASWEEVDPEKCSPISVLELLSDPDSPVSDLMLAPGASFYDDPEQSGPETATEGIVGNYEPFSVEIRFSGIEDKDHILSKLDAPAYVCFAEIVFSYQVGNDTVLQVISIADSFLNDQLPSFGRKVFSGLWSREMKHYNEHNSIRRESENPEETLFFLALITELLKLRKT